MFTQEQRDQAERIPLAEAYPKLGAIVRRVAANDAPVVLTSHGTDLVFVVSVNYRPNLGIGETDTRGSSGGRRVGSVVCQTCRATAGLIGTPAELADSLAEWIAVHTAPDHIAPAGTPAAPEGTQPA